MEPEPRYVRIIKILAIKIFPALIFAMLTALFIIPSPKKPEPRTAATIEAEIKKIRSGKGHP